MQNPTPADTTTIHLQEGEQTNIVIPAGYQPDQITIIKNQPAPYEEPKRPPPETILDELIDADNSLEVSDRLKFLRKVYIIVGSIYVKICSHDVDHHWILLLVILRQKFL